VKVNCAEIPAGLFESELFLHEQVQRSIGRGLFVGAWALVGRVMTTNKELENRCINTIRILSADASRTRTPVIPNPHTRGVLWSSTTARSYTKHSIFAGPFEPPGTVPEIAWFKPAKANTEKVTSSMASVCRSNSTHERSFRLGQWQDSRIMARKHCGGKVRQGQEVLHGSSYRSGPKIRVR